MTQTVDAHHHLWNYSKSEYGWISDQMGALRRDFNVDDFGRERLSAGVTGSIAVQARQTIAETDWLLETARANSSIQGVVGWLPICSTWLPRLLASYKEHPHLKGLRHVVQDEPDPNFVLSPAFNRGIRALMGSELTYDLVVRQDQLPQTIRFVEMHPNQAFVLDHLGKPLIGSAPSAQWVQSLRELAAMPHVSCKLSGLVTEANWSDWSLSSLQPYLDTALDVFGAERLMTGSDWPVCLLASTYQRWWETLRSWAAALPFDQQEQIFSETAQRVYGLR